MGTQRNSIERSHSYTWGTPCTVSRITRHYSKLQSTILVHDGLLVVLVYTFKIYIPVCIIIIFFLKIHNTCGDTYD